MRIQGRRDWGRIKERGDNEPGAVLGESDGGSTADAREGSGDQNDGLVHFQLQ